MYAWISPFSFLVQIYSDIPTSLEEMPKVVRKYRKHREASYSDSSGPSSRESSPDDYRRGRRHERGRKERRRESRRDRDRPRDRNRDRLVIFLSYQEFIEPAREHVTACVLCRQ